LAEVVETVFVPTAVVLASVATFPEVPTLPSPAASPVRAIASSTGASLPYDEGDPSIPPSARPAAAS
jgi:hypothetical protein